MKRSHLNRLLAMSLGIAGTILIGGQLTDAVGQARDPFVKPGWARTREPRAAKSAAASKPAVPQDVVLVPSIEQRIEYFKRLRETAAMNDQPLPKVTSVLTLNEMAVTGIFKTPRGYAAMVEAVPIKLSYTIYPGEKFFDGQLVAVEENRLVFRKVTKTGKNKFVATVENKTLRKYTADQEIQGTAPAQSTGRPPETIATYQPPEPSASPAPTRRPAGSGNSAGTGMGMGSGSGAGEDSEPAARPIVVASPYRAGSPAEVVSPLDEMERQAPEPDAKKKTAAKGKKTIKVARNK